MKKSSFLVFTIPLVIVCLVVAGVVVMRLVTPVQPTQQATTRSPAEMPSLSGKGTKPTVGFGSMQATNPVSDLRQQYDTTQDTDSATSLQSLQSDAVTL